MKTKHQEEWTCSRCGRFGDNLKGWLLAPLVCTDCQTMYERVIGRPDDTRTETDSSPAEPPR